MFVGGVAEMLAAVLLLSDFVFLLYFVHTAHRRVGKQPSSSSSRFGTSCILKRAAAGIVLGRRLRKIHGTDTS